MTNRTDQDEEWWASAIWGPGSRVVNGRTVAAGVPESALDPTDGRFETTDDAMSAIAGAIGASAHLFDLPGILRAAFRRGTSPAQRFVGDQRQYWRRTCSGADFWAVVAEHCTSERALRADYIVQRFEGDVFDMDRIAIQHLRIRRWQERQGYNGFTDISDSQDDLCELGSYYLDGGDFLVARSKIDRRVLGFIGLHRTGPATAEITRHAVEPAEQGTGIGTALLDDILDSAVHLGIAEVNLATGASEQGRPLYERAGFVVVARNPKHGDCLMRRTLPAAQDAHAC